MRQKRPYGQKLPEAGKLETPCAKGRAQEGGKDMAHPLTISPVTPAGGYRIKGSVNGVGTSFRLYRHRRCSDPFERRRLGEEQRRVQHGPPTYSSVSTDLHSVSMDVGESTDLAGEKLQAEVVVVSPLTTEAILGLDFLREHKATINLEKEQLCLGDRGCVLSLSKPTQRAPDMKPSVQTLEAFDIPLCSEVEVQASLQEPVGEGPWLLEGVEGKRLPAAIARELVQPKANRVPVHRLNPRPESVRIHRGTEIATLEAVDSPTTADAVIANVTPDEVLQEKREMLWSLAENWGSELDGNEREKFFQLLLMYADIFASSKQELGRTDRLRHNIPTPPFVRLYGVFPHTEGLRSKIYWAT